MQLKSKTTRVEVTRSLFDTAEEPKKTHDITYRYDLDQSGAISNLNGDCRKADTGQTVINMSTANGVDFPGSFYETVGDNNAAIMEAMKADMVQLFNTPMQ